MKKLDNNLIIYLSVLIISWVIIVWYIINLENEKYIKKELESYPFEHSQITDSTLKTK
jgi:hypothetical protein